jgi:arylsulfatase A-like enzyme
MPNSRASCILINASRQKLTANDAIQTGAPIREVRKKAFVSPLRCAVAALALPVLLASQAVAQTTSKPATGSNWQPDRRTLPIQLKDFDGVVRRNAADSKPAFPPLVQAPKGAPNVLVIMSDDVGFGATSTFGGSIETPTMDRLAREGLRYNTFHTTGLCSPTRASLLTGRNHHTVNAATIPDSGMGFPGYNSIIPKTAASIATILKGNGFSTAMFGKWHNIPVWEETPIGPYDHWPMGMGFEYSYSLITGGANEFAPIVSENGNISSPAAGRKDYYFETDMTDKAIGWLRSVAANSNGKPFFMYYAPWAAHAGHQAPKEDIERFRGRFDAGWDVLREQIFQRQKVMGVVPANARLTPRPAQIPSWDSLSEDQRKVYARLMEAYAGMLYHSDMQVGRLIEELRAQGKLDNTLVVYIAGDNGASGEGGIEGAVNSWAILTDSSTESTEYKVSVIDKIGSRTTEPNYPAGWAWAMNTPFQWMKQVSSHFGGTRNGMVLHWPKGVRTPGGIRSQFTHVNDIAPTILEAAGLPAPDSVDGVKQIPYDGVSLVYSINQENAPERHRQQYFEMLGNRGMYADGWMASTTPRRMPWQSFGGTANPADDYTWELYDVRSDFSQANDLAKRYPDKLKALQDLWWSDSGKYHVAPLLDTLMSRTSIEKPNWNDGRKSYQFYSGSVGIRKGAFPFLVNRSFTITADVTEPEGNGSGIVATQGGISGGWALMVRGGKPAFVYALSDRLRDITWIESGAPMGLGRHSLKFDFIYDGGGRGNGALGRLTVNGKAVAERRIPRTSTVFFTPYETLDIGQELGSPVVEDYFDMLPFRYSGVLNGVKIDLGPIDMPSDILPAKDPPAALNKE